MNEEQAKNALNRAQEQKRRSERIRPSNISRFIRKILPEILQAKESMSWNEIAESLSDQGLQWKTGKTLTGSDLRSIIHRIQISEIAKSIKAEQETPLSKMFNQSKNTPLPDPAIIQKPSIQENTQKPKPTKRTNILDEMRKSKNERG